MVVINDRSHRIVPKSRTVEIESGEDKSIDEILTLMDGIDPEQLYTTLTDNERDDNSFPAEKAVKWFAALKDVLDKNS